MQFLREPGHALTTIGHSALFAQNQWFVNSRLTVNAGVRFDHWNGSLGPDVFEAGPWSRGERVDDSGERVAPTTPPRIDAIACR